MESSSSDDRGSFDETAQIELQVLSVEPAKAGRLAALAVVSMALDGVPVELHGVRVVRRPDARSTSSRRPIEPRRLLASY